MTVTMPIDRVTAKALPESVFASPTDIVTDNRLTSGETRGTLRRWADHQAAIAELDRPQA